MLRWFMRILGVLVFVAIALVTVILLLPKDRLAAIAAEQIGQMLNRPVRVLGQVQPSFYPQLGVRAEGLIIGGAGDAEVRNLLESQSLSIGVDLISLISGKIDVNELTVISPVLFLQRDMDGKLNWGLGDSESEAEAVAENASPNRFDRFSFKTIALTDSQVVFEDMQSGRKIDLNGADIVLNMDPTDQSIEFQMLGQVNNEAVRIDANIENLQKLLAAEAQAIFLSGEIGGSSFSFDGLVDLRAKSRGQLQLDLSDLAAVFAVAGMPAPSFNQSIKLSGEVLISAEQADLNAARIQVGPNALNGSASLIFAEKPFLSGSFQSQNLIFDTNQGSGGDGSGAGAGWSNAAIDASALSTIDAKISLNSTALQFAGRQFANARLNLTIDRARAVLLINNLTGFGGTIAGQLVANNRNGLSVGGDVRMQNVSLKTVLSDLLGFDRLTGRGQAQLDFLASGNSVQQFMNTLRGSGRLSVGQGTLTGIDLARLFGGESASDGTTVFDSIGASFNISAGVLSNSDLAISAPVFRALGKGTVGLGSRVVDYTITPEIFGGEEINGIALPVRITGPWSNLSIFPDFEALAQQRIDRELQEQEQRLRDKAAESLGLDTSDGQSIEDALEDKLEEELRRGLGRLLGGN